MPKKIERDEEDEELEEELEEEEEEFEEDLPPMKKKPKKLRPKINKPQPKEPKQRYVAFNIPPRMGIMDAETNEVVAEGEFAMLQAQANMIERLERIENSIGSIMEG